MNKCTTIVGNNFKLRRHIFFKRQGRSGGFESERGTIRKVEADLALYGKVQRRVSQNQKEREEPVKIVRRPFTIVRLLLESVTVHLSR
eukprot:3780841-Amphidinium_carterae.1